MRTRLRSPAPGSTLPSQGRGSEARVANPLGNGRPPISTRPQKADAWAGSKMPARSANPSEVLVGFEGCRALPASSGARRALGFELDETPFALPDEHRAQMDGSEAVDRARGPAHFQAVDLSRIADPEEGR